MPRVSSILAYFPLMLITSVATPLPKTSHTPRSQRLGITAYLCKGDSSTLDTGPMTDPNILQSRADSMAQWVEGLPTMPEALGSVCSTASKG